MMIGRNQQLALFGNFCCRTTLISLFRITRSWYWQLSVLWSPFISYWFDFISTSRSVTGIECVYVNGTGVKWSKSDPDIIMKGCSNYPSTIALGSYLQSAVLTIWESQKFRAINLYDALPSALDLWDRTSCFRVRLSMSGNISVLIQLCLHKFSRTTSSFLSFINSFRSSL